MVRGKCIGITQISVGKNIAFSGRLFIGYLGYIGISVLRCFLILSLVSTFQFLNDGEHLNLITEEQGGLSYKQKS